MRIVSLVPHATELLFALGLGREVVAVTHECDHPPQALALAKVTRDALPAGLSSGEIDAQVRERTLRGESIYELDRAALSALAPDLIVTQALCPVCAVSYEDVAAIAQRAALAPARDRARPERRSARRSATCARWRRRPASTDAGVELVHEAAARIDRVKLAVRGQRRVRVAALEWLDPVYVAGHWTPQMIEYAGGEDVLGFAGEPSQTMSWEQVAAGEPEVVVVMPCGYDAPRAREEALAHARTARGAGRGTRRRGRRVGLLLAPGTAADRRPGAARARASPDALCRRAARRRAARGRAHAGRALKHRRPAARAAQPKPVPPAPAIAIEPATAAADSATQASSPSQPTPRSSAVRIARPASAPPISPPM